MARKPKSGFGGLVSRRRKITGRGKPLAYSDLRRLSPDENEQLGFTRKARRYVLKSIRKLTKRTHTTSARERETLRVKQEYGLASPEVATRARRDKALSYKSAAAQETAARNRKDTTSRYTQTFLAATTRDARVGVRINKADGKRKGRVSFKVKEDTAAEALANRASRLRGEFIPDGEYQMMLDYSAHYGDPFYEFMRGSPKDKTGNIEG